MEPSFDMETVNGPRDRSVRCKTHVNKTHVVIGKILEISLEMFSKFMIFRESVIGISIAVYLCSFQDSINSKKFD